MDLGIPWWRLERGVLMKTAPQREGQLLDSTEEAGGPQRDPQEAQERRREGGQSQGWGTGRTKELPHRGVQGR